MNVNDGTTNLPRMDIQQAWWSMRGLGNEEREWTIEEKFAKISEAGFTGILGKTLPEPDEVNQWRQLLDKHNFSYGINAVPSSREDFREFLKQAKDFGVQYINAQVMDYFVVGDKAVKLLHELLEEAFKAEIPLYIETHRGRITQDLLRTVEYVKKIKDLRLTIDLSHYILASEIRNYDERYEPYFDELLTRTSSIHARVSNGQQIQVDIGPNGEHLMTEHFTQWWRKGITYWLESAKPGDVLPFVCEIGPPTYAISKFEYINLQGEELSNRWEQGLLFKKIAEGIWNEVHQPITSI
ncbi:sugar phosphate isomerase/epimerase family protein [Mesobacillus campisalis]|nr:TIM barrel protein [Mesobacillus campisalis]